MTPVVIGASVAVKWFLRDSDDERHAADALRWLRLSCSGDVRFLQPPHFRTEVAAVLSRLKPGSSAADIAELFEMEFSILDNPDVYQEASRLSVRLQYHLFDTMYHALALTNPGVHLITADERYYRKARHVGAIEALGDHP